MKKTFLIAAAIAALPYAASALIDATDANLGQSCWSDGDGVDYTLVKCEPGNLVDMWTQTCGRTYAETQSDGTFVASGAGTGNNYGFGASGLHCIAGMTSNAFYVCTQEGSVSAGPACKDSANAARYDYPPAEKEFVAESGDTHRVYFTVYDCDYGTEGMLNGGYTHKLNCRAVKEYGCAAGYYHSGGAQYSDSYTCSPCPAPGTSWIDDGTSIDSNGITSCFIPAGTAFSDDTGSGTYKSNCYYKL